LITGRTANQSINPSYVWYLDAGDSKMTMASEKKGEGERYKKL
jgi:hypothetical protein